MLDITISKLADWLETWRTQSGAYNGFVVHRFSQKRMLRIHDTAWTQAAMIRGYANLYERTRNKKWYNRMILAADLQCSRLEKSTGKYRYAGHEDDRFCSLVHCALADVALMRAAGLVDADRRQKYIDAVRTNLDKYCLAKLWVPEEQAFKFSEVDYWSESENRYVVNFNIMGAETLLSFSEVTGESVYKKYALQIGEWLIRNCDEAREYNARLLAGKKTVKDDPKSEWMAPGGLAYQYTPSQKDPDNCVLIYGGLALRGLCALWRETEDRRYAEIIRENVSFILTMRDDETRLFYHTTDKGKVVRWPQFIAGAGMILVGLHEARKTLGESWQWEDTVNAILSRQYKNGSFPGFAGKATGNRRYQGRVWEDDVATPNWNSQLFEYLTLSVDCFEGTAHTGVTAVVHPCFWYFDTPVFVFILSYFPISFSCLYLACKRWPVSLICVFPQVAIGKIKDLKKKFINYVQPKNSI